MKDNNNHTEVMMMLLNIQNNLSYIEKELDNLGITDEEKLRVRAIADPYIVEIYDAFSEWAKIGESFGVITIDYLLEERTNTLSNTERITIIKNILSTHNQSLVIYTDALIARSDTMKLDTEMTGLMVLITESVGNILRLTKDINEALSNIQL